MTASDALYRPLKAYCVQKGGSRLRMHGALRDKMIEAIVEEWPVGCPQDRMEEVITARMKVRMREQYGFVIASFLLAILVAALIKLALDWWFARESHRVLMVGWARQAQERG